MSGSPVRVLVLDTKIVAVVAASGGVVAVAAVLSFSRSWRLILLDCLLFPLLLLPLNPNWLCLLSRLLLAVTATFVLLPLVAVVVVVVMWLLFIFVTVTAIFKWLRLWSSCSQVHFCESSSLSISFCTLFSSFTCRENWETNVESCLICKEKVKSSC